MCIVRATWYALIVNGRAVGPYAHRPAAHTSELGITACCMYVDSKSDLQMSFGANDTYTSTRHFVMTRNTIKA